MARPARHRRPVVLVALLCALLASVQTAVPARAAEQPSASELLAAAVNRLIELVEPPEGAAARTFSGKVRIVKADGLPREAAGATAEFAVQAPDRLRVSAAVLGETYAAARDGQEIWVHEPGKKFALIGRNGVPRFKADPNSVEDVTLPPFALPISRFQVRVALLATTAELLPPEKVDGVDCDVIDVAVQPTVADLLRIRAGTARLWLRRPDRVPLRVTYTDGRAADVRIDVIDPQFSEPWPNAKWKIAPNEGDHVETVALSHLVKFMTVGRRMMDNRIPTLGPATGKRQLVATQGKGRLELIDGTRVLFLKGTPDEMGRQHGKLLRDEVRDVSERILYGVGVGSSFVKGNWFFGEIEGAQARLERHMDPRYLREMDALANAAKLHPQEGRLSNFFPELFHCSGFALVGESTKDGHVYHGRVLDYLRGVGLEQNAVVIVHQPDEGHAWVNLGYAGFVGTVTAMNEKGISIGEMGGRGYGAWDGKPMAQLMREVMERAGTLDEAVEIMRKGPRTCEYYYVIADGKSKQAVGIGATPDTFEVVQPGAAHPRLPTPVPDTVLLSAGDRYDTLAKRVKTGWGQFDARSARELMSKPVCMSSNIQSVLFRPDTLDFWVANADSRSVASETRYTHYNLRELLKAPAAPEPGVFGF